MHRQFLSLLFIALLSACSSSGPTGNPGSLTGGSAPSPPTAWTLWFSPGTSLGAGPSFAFPQWTSASCPGPTGFNQTCPSVQYLVNASGALKSTQTITLKFTITGSSPQWNYANIQNDGNTCTSPAAVHLYFQEAGDNWSGSGAYAYYRWWSTASATLALGTLTLSIPLNGAWTSVEGESNTNSAASQAGFAQALANANTIGLTFGGGCFDGHGVDLLGGSATFTLNSFTVQ